MPRSVRARTERLRTDALLVRSAPFGDADLMVTFFTEVRGIVTAAGRSARRSQKRFPALELRLLAHVGCGMDLERCVRCGKGCDAGASAYLDAGQGGLVCRSCGGARMLLRGEMREKLLAALNGEDAALGEGEVKVAVE